MIGRYVVVYDISFVVARSDGRGERKIFVKVQEQRMQGGFPGIVRMDYGAVPAVGVLQTSAVGLCDCRLMCTFIDIGQGHGDKRGSNFSMTLLPFLSARDASVDEDPCRSCIFLFPLVLFANVKPLLPSPRNRLQKLRKRWSRSVMIY